MSRSFRKTPISGAAICHSERYDKQRWHKRWRQHQRVVVKTATPESLAGHLPILEREVSNVWDMGKDGHIYRSLASQIAGADRVSEKRGRNSVERASLKMRLLHKWMGK